MQILWHTRARQTKAALRNLLDVGKRAARDGDGTLREQRADREAWPPEREERRRGLSWMLLIAIWDLASVGSRESHALTVERNGVYPVVVGGPPVCGIAVWGTRFHARLAGVSLTAALAAMPCVRRVASVVRWTAGELSTYIACRTVSALRLFCPQNTQVNKKLAIELRQIVWCGGWCRLGALLPLGVFRGPN